MSPSSVTAPSDAASAAAAANPETFWGAVPDQRDAWPTPAQELLLQATLMRDERALLAWRQVRPQLDIARLDGPSQALLPMLRKNLIALGVEDELLALFKGVHRYNWARTQTLLAPMVPRVQALERAGIPTLLLKGAAFIADTRLDAGMRSMNDIDVLVPSERTADAVAVLLQEGLVTGGRGAALVRRRVRTPVRPQSRLPRRARSSAGPALERPARLPPAGRGRGLLGRRRPDRAAGRTHPRAVPRRRAAAGRAARPALERASDLSLGARRGGDRIGHVRGARLTNVCSSRRAGDASPSRCTPRSPTCAVSPPCRSPTRPCARSGTGARVRWSASSTVPR